MSSPDRILVVVGQNPAPCIYCRRIDGPFTSREHPMPEGLGNTEIVLPVGVVCDPCNNGPLARIDEVFLNFMPVAALRVFQGVPTKAGAYPPRELRQHGDLGDRTF